MVGNVIARHPESGEFGRVTVYTDEKQITSGNIEDVLSKALAVHQVNRSRIQRLWDVYRGKQDILGKTKTVRPEINNKIVENRANEIVTFKTGYLLGEPLQYVNRSQQDSSGDEINRLNDFMLVEHKAQKDKLLADWMHICGVAFRMVLPNPVPDDENPYKLYTLDPRETFVVYSSDLGNEPMLAVKFRQTEKNVIYSCYSRDRYFELTDGKLTSHRPHPLGIVPVVEYSANISKQGAFEIVLTLLDAINSLDSARLDGVEQFVQAVMKFINCEIDKNGLDQMRELGAIMIKSHNGQQADMKLETAELNQTQTQTLKQDIHQAILDICGMPNRNGGSSTSDTGSAVIMRDGWSTAEARAKDTELMFKAAERQFLRIVLRICDTVANLKLKLSDIEIKFTRRNYSDLLSKTQTLTTMLDNGKIHPELAFTHCGLFIDPESAYAKSLEWVEQQEKKLAQTQQDEGHNPTEGDDKTAGSEPVKTQQSTKTGSEPVKTQEET